jgi:hypothetical protein
LKFHKDTYSLCSYLKHKKVISSVSFVTKLENRMAKHILAGMLALVGWGRRWRKGVEGG